MMCAKFVQEQNKIINIKSGRKKSFIFYDTISFLDHLHRFGGSATVSCDM